MKDTKTMLRFYTIADFREEEIWLREEHRNGWKLTKMRPPCFFRFEKCEPEDVIYRLDFKNSSETAITSRCLPIMDGNMCLPVWAGCIFANRRQM